jgi:RHS repeat-associated protein
LSFRKAVFLTFAFLFFFQNLPLNAQEGFSQSPTGGLKPSPNSENVLLNTGTATVAIPIWNHENKDVSLPISLSYNGRGVKVNDVSSRVGTNWNLNAGGVVTREIRGLPDDVYSVKRNVIVNVNQSAVQTFTNAGYLYSGQTPKQLFDKNINDYTADELDILSTQKKDVAPDLFRFQCGSYSGTFMFDENGTPRLFPESNLKISYDKQTADLSPYLGGPLVNTDVIRGCITKFYITTPDGTNYTFSEISYTKTTFRRENVQNLTECTTQNLYGAPLINFFGKVNINSQTGDIASTSYYPDTKTEDLAITSWYLTNIKSVNGNEINLQYSNEQIADTKIIQQEEFNDPITEKTTTWADTRIFDKKLTTISSLNETVEFVADINREDIYNNGLTFIPTLLRNIDIKNSTNQLIKRFEFTYGSYSSTTTACDSDAKMLAHKKRYKLESLKEIGKDGVLAEQPYIFQYNTTSLPPRHSFSKDLGGYYNGANNTNLIPKLYVYDGTCDNNPHNALYQDRYSPYDRGYTSCTARIIPGANRDPNINFAKAGILEKIIYPKGGSVTFEYELNEFSYLPETEYSTLSINNYLFNRKGTGLRVKRVTQSDESNLNPNIVKEYLYHKVDGLDIAIPQSSGRLIQMPSFGRRRVFAQYLTSGLIFKPIKDFLFARETETPIIYQYVTVKDIGGGYVTYKYNIPAVYGSGFQNNECGLASTSNIDCMYNAPTTEYSSTPNANLLADNPEVNKNNYPFAPNPIHDWNRGLLLEQKIYDASNKLLKFVKNEYTALNSLRIKALAYDIEAIRGVGTGVTVTISPPFFTLTKFKTSKPSYAIGKYSNVSAFKALIKQETWDYLDNTNAVYSKVDYKYDDAATHAPTEILSSNSDGKYNKTTIKYSFGVTDPSTYENQLAIIYLRVQNRFTPIEIKQFTAPSVTGTYTQVGGTKYKYDILAGMYRLKSIENYQGNAWLTKKTIDEYTTDGFVKRAHDEGYPETALLWENGLLKQKTVTDGTNILKDVYEYWADTRLLKSITSVNGEKVYREYDNLLRPKITKGRFNSTSNAYGTTTELTYWTGVENNVKVSKETSVTTFSDYTNAQTSTSYSDGLGRPILAERVGYTSSYQQQKSYLSYDQLGRLSRNYHPFESPSVGFQIPPTGTSYVTKEYEASPISRPLKQFSEDGKYIRAEYSTNIAGDVFMSQANGSLSINTYPANTLFKTTVYDENSTTLNVTDKYKTETFIDKFGRNILTRRYVTEDGVLKKAETYNSYDDKGNMIATLPPNCRSIVNDASFRYEYDSRNRPIRKRVPGSDWVEVYYDTNDRVVLTQDGNMRTPVNSKVKFLAIKYDILGREIETGFIERSSSADNSRTAIEALALTINANTTLTESMTKTFYRANSTLVSATHAKVLGNKKATDADWVITNIDYDQYNRAEGTTGTTHLGTYNSQYFPQNMADAATANFHSWVSADNQYMATLQYNYFDHGLRPSMTTHAIVLDNTWSNITPQRTVSLLKYNEKDQLIEKNLGRFYNYWTGESRYLQSIDYTFNSKGLLKSINATNTSTDALPLFVHNIDPTWSYTGVAFSTPTQAGDNNTDFFREELNYDVLNPSLPGITPPQYNGNISQILWQVAGREPQAFSYKYDEINRMTDANSTEIHTGSWNNRGWSGGQYTTDNKFYEGVAYDLRGNIKNLTRKGVLSSESSFGFISGVFGTIDNLSYTYNGKNQISTIVDGGSPTKGFAYTPDPNAHYTYDANGNITSDKHKKITKIDYNYLNLPVRMELEGSNAVFNDYLIERKRVIEFLYDASGNMCRKTAKQVAEYTFCIGCGQFDVLNEARDYIDGVEYKTTVTNFVETTQADVIPFTEGYVQRDPTTDGNWNWQGWMYKYVLNDHLGNARVTFSDRDNDGTVTLTDIEQINHFYPFGLNMEGNWNGHFPTVQNKFQYNSKELTTNFGLNLYNFNHRWYDGASARFTSIDPLADNYSDFAPYVFAGNQVPNAIDYMGLGPIGGVGGGILLDAFTVTAKSLVTARQVIGLSIVTSLASGSNSNKPYNGYVKNKDGSYTQVNNEGGEDYDVIYNGCTSCTIFKDVIMYNNTGGTRLLPGIWHRPTQGGLTPVDDPFTFGLAGGLRKLGSFLFSSGATKGGAHLVYQGVDKTGIVRYVGITERNPLIRFGEHLNALGTGKELLRYRAINGATGLSKIQARVWEQTLINQYGLGKNGGQLLNKINSIAPKYWWQHGIN